MRHQKSGRKFGRLSAHRKSMFSNMVSSLLEHEKIQTTEAKAKELRRIAEPVITWAISVGDLLQKPQDKRSLEDKARIVHAIRMAGRTVKNRQLLQKLFDVIGPRFLGRRGGYTRITKIGYRAGDAAPLTFIELVS